MAILALYFFFYKNKLKDAIAHITDQQLYNLAKDTANSENQDDAMRNILRTIKPPLKRVS